MPQQGDVYGGLNWIANALSTNQAAAEAVLQRLLMELNRQLATGYVQSNPLAMPPSREQALMAIWNARKDIRDMYKNYWGEDVNPIEAMENWVTITTEEGAKDPITFATNAGYLEPYTPGPQVPTLEREQMQGSQALQYLSLLASQRGPQDWISYWNTVRNAQQTNLPAWAQALAQNLNLPAFQGPTTVPPSVPGQGAPATGTTTEGGTMPTISPIQITPQQYNNLLPSEIAGLQGLVEQSGGWMPDFLAQMQRAWPTGRVGTSRIWG